MIVWGYFLNAPLLSFLLSFLLSSTLSSSLFPLPSVCFRTGLENFRVPFPSRRLYYLAALPLYILQNAVKSASTIDPTLHDEISRSIENSDDLRDKEKVWMRYSKFLGPGGLIWRPNAPIKKLCVVKGIISSPPSPFSRGSGSAKPHFPIFAFIVRSASSRSYVRLVYPSANLL